MLDHAIAPAPGFCDPAVESAASFRALLQTMARPGRVQPIEAGLAPPHPLMASTAAALLTLVDFDTPLWIEPALRSGAAAEYLRFHCAARLVETPAEAGFVLVTTPAARPPLAGLRQGTPDYPDRSATLVIQVKALAQDGPIVLSGPGIETVHRFSAPPLDTGFWREMQVNATQFPLGVDAILCGPDAVAAVPRSTTIAIAEAG